MGCIIGKQEDSKLSVFQITNIQLRKLWDVKEIEQDAIGK